MASAKKTEDAKSPVAPGAANEIVANKEMFFNEMEGFGTGLENVTANDLLIPRLTILQGLSPQVTQGKAEFDPNAKVGQIYDVGLSEGFDILDGITAIPVHYVKQWLEWAPRNTGKGLQGVHDTPTIVEKTTKDEKGRLVLPNGNYIAETAQFYILNVSAGFRKSFIPMTSTQLKKGRRMITLATDERLMRADGSEFTPPLFYRQYHLTTVPESNNEGSWMGWKIERGDSIDTLPNFRSLMVQIKDFRDALTKGDLKADMATLAEEANSGPVIEGEAM